MFTLALLYKCKITSLCRCVVLEVVFEVLLDLITERKCLFYIPSQHFFFKTKIMWVSDSAAAIFCPGVHLKYLKTPCLTFPEAISSCVFLTHINPPLLYSISPKLEKSAL